MPDLYDPQFVKSLFDEMARTYGVVNTLSSFGFNRRWRRQCVRAIRIPAGGQAIDLMTGMGTPNGSDLRYQTAALMKILPQINISRNSS